MKINIGAVIFAGLFFLSGCMMMDSQDRYHSGHHSNAPYYKPGPPPHAPAHGYRHKHYDGHDLEYDSTLGVYIVLRDADTYFSNNVYIRMSLDGTWLVSSSLDTGWHLAAGNEIPYKLKKYKESNRKDRPGKNKAHKKNKYNDRDEDD